MNIKYLYTKIAAFLIAVPMLFAGCTKSFEELRIDPEGVLGAQPSSFLSNALYRANSTFIYRGQSINNQLMQVTAGRTADNEIHRYVLKPLIYDQLWLTYSQIANIEEMLNLSIKVGDKNYTAIAYTLKAYMVSILTDTHGDIPFTEAFKGNQGIIRPVFDEQKLIYDTLLDNLETANGLYDLTKVLSGEDILFSANTSAANIIKWKKFTNALHIRLLMRVAHKSPVYEQKLRDILANPTTYPLMSSVAESAAIYHTNVAPNLNPFYNTTDLVFSSSVGFTEFFVNSMNVIGDPRLPLWATKVSGTYRGVPTAYPFEDQDLVSGSSWSTYVNTLKKSNLFGSIIQYAEQEFILAEACLKGYMNDDPKKHYDNGVKASCNYWGIATVDIPAAFLGNPAIVYDGTLEQIITQKYYALFMNDFQQWFEYRRTGFPVLGSGPSAQNNGVLPVRIPYPTDIAAYNAVNYAAVVARNGKDDLNTKVWWQKP
jgi:hypothetical protein